MEVNQLMQRPFDKGLGVLTVTGSSSVVEAKDGNGMRRLIWQGVCVETGNENDIWGLPTFAHAIGFRN